MKKKVAIFILGLVLLPIYLIGKIIFYISKPVRALGFLLMGNVYSAKEEITEWNILVNIKDVL